MIRRAAKSKPPKTVRRKTQVIEYLPEYGVLLRLPDKLKSDTELIASFGKLFTYEQMGSHFTCREFFHALRSIFELVVRHEYHGIDIYNEAYITAVREQVLETIIDYDMGVSADR